MPRFRPFRLIVACLAFALLAACGNKGPLVHPDTSKPAPPQPSSTQPAPSSANPETH
jgi:predicted small lipoprotein YifL